MKKKTTGVGGEFRIDFRSMDASALISIGELATLLNTTDRALYVRMARHRDSLPPRREIPGIRTYRFAVGDVREWLAALRPTNAPATVPGAARLGRPRKPLNVD